MRVLGVTGATGYIGTALLARARAAGWRVIALGRKSTSLADECRYTDLAQPFDAKLLDGLHAVMHLAADVTGKQLPAGTELAYTRALAMACQQARTPLVYFSSQAASETAPSAYGRNKAQLEQVAGEFGAITIRPSMVVGGAPAGLFGLLVKLVKISPLVPDLLPRPRVRPVHVDDVANAALAAIDKPELAGRRLFVAGPAIAFSELLCSIGWFRLGRRRLRVPIPSALLRWMLVMASKILGTGLSPERLDSLTQLPDYDPTADLAALNVALKPLCVTLDRRASVRRALFKEAQVLTRAVLAQHAPAHLLRRYAKLMLRLELAPVDFPSAILSSPLMLAGLDAPKQRRVAIKGDLSWRMDAISRLAEAEPAWAAQYLSLPGRAGIWRVALDFARAGLREVQVRMLAPFARRHLRRVA